MVLGFFEVMSYFQHELPLWKDVWKIKREFEQSIVRHLAGNVTHTTGQNRKRNKPSAQLGVPTKEVLDIMNKIKPRHPRSLITEPAAQGSKRKARRAKVTVLVKRQTRAEALSPTLRRKNRSSE